MNKQKIDLLALLPAGEWADVQVLNQPPGMMAGRNWAILAKAKWLRKGGKAAFIKFIIPAGGQAGPDTEMVTGKARLRHLAERLKAVQILGDAVPLVPLLQVKDAEGGLLIAMEQVEPLQNIVDRGEAYALSVRLLRDLDPEAKGGHSWLHFDICPMNIGVLPSGRCVLIDVESFYLQQRVGHYDVSIPAWKPFRAPQGLERDVDEKLAANDVDNALALRKVRFEVALSAAECVLGPLPPSRENLSRARVEEWVAGADPADPAVAFWRNEILRGIDSGAMRSMAELALDLERLIQGQSVQNQAPLAIPVSQPRNVSLSRGPEEHKPAPAPNQATPGWSTDWELLKPAAHALRSGKLDRARIAEYRAALERLALHYPVQREVWDELLLVLISYQKDAGAAHATIETALQQIPGDVDLMRLRDIVKMWAAERPSEKYGG